MCIICLEFNKNKDIFDTIGMINAAMREPTSISLRHLVLLEKELSKRQSDPKNMTDIEIEDLK